MSDDRWQAFLDHLVETGDANQAKQAAGYAARTSISDLLRTPERQSQVKQKLSEYMTIAGAKAVHKLVYLLDNPSEYGGQVLRGAATDVLDRIGLSKQDSIEISIKQPDGVLEIPPKKPVPLLEDGSKTDSGSEVSETDI